MCAALAVLAIGSAGCERSGTPTATLYTSIDQPFAEQIVADFQRTSGIHVDVVYDAEAGKTTGFLRRIEREKDRPRCDVWWSSEVFGTIELARAGLLESYDSPAAADIPPLWRDRENRWTGSAARARVLAFDPRRFRVDELPQTWRALAEPRWAKELALANPLFGTTRGHFAAMLAFWGDAPFEQFVQNLRDAAAQLADGNNHAVRLVANGAAGLCMTDTDDVWVMQARGGTLALLYPRIEENGPPLWIPCSVALVKNAPHPDSARKLIDYLVSAAAERALAKSESRNVPVRPAVRAELAAELKFDGRAPEPLDFERIADSLSASGRIVREKLVR
jgi:iron(III) transport system substrate-binding protein